MDIEVDDTYSEDLFDVVSGEKSFKIDKLAACVRARVPAPRRG